MDKYQRYRLKDLEGYKRKKRDQARTPEQRTVRTVYMRKWREKNRARHNQLAKESQQRNKHKHVDYRRNYHLQKQFGLTLADYDKMFINQQGLCLICSTDKPARGRFHVDHDHKTNFVRGLLCSRCNGALGWYEKYSASIKIYLKEG